MDYPRLVRRAQESSGLVYGLAELHVHEVIGEVACLQTESEPELPALAIPSPERVPAVGVDVRSRVVAEPLGAERPGGTPGIAEVVERVPHT